MVATNACSRKDRKGGRVWLIAPVLKTGGRKVRGFESYPFRHIMVGDQKDITGITRQVHNLPGEYPFNGPEAVFGYLMLHKKQATCHLGLITVEMKDGSKFYISTHSIKIDDDLSIRDGFIDAMKAEIGRSPDAFVVTWHSAKPTSCVIVGCVSKKKFMDRGRFTTDEDGLMSFTMDWKLLEPIDKMHHWLEEKAKDKEE